MPQLEASSYLSQLFWLVLCFVTLLYISWRITLPRFERILSERWARIQGALENAHKLKQEAKLLEEQYEESLAAARRQSHEEVLDASRLIALSTSKHKSEITQRMKERFRASEQALENTRITALNEVQGIAETLGTSIVKKILGIDIIVRIDTPPTSALKRKVANAD